jgi:hypothetical protein
MDSPVQGTFGQRCFPGGTVTEATGTVGQADVVRLAHCNAGLSCGSDGLCATIPDCPQPSGTCAVYRTDLGLPGSGGSGGTTGGAGGAVLGAGGGVPGGAVAEAGILALAADDAQLYWVEYGTRDSLGNYQNDGALMALAFAEGTATKLASQLPGPVALGMTSTHVYVYVDGAPLIGNPRHPQLLRLPLSGGAPELVQDGLNPSYSSIPFAGAGDRAFWSTDSAIYELASDAGATPSVFVANWGSSLAADAADLFYVRLNDTSSSDVFWRAPLDRSAQKQLALPPYAFALSGNFIYGLEPLNNNTVLILDRAPKTGEFWQRVGALGAGGFVRSFQVVGDRYFFDVNPPRAQNDMPDDTRVNIETASFASPDQPVRLLEIPAAAFGLAPPWVGTATALYWSDGNAIYSIAVPNP